jgi:hypothetical protein
MDIHLEKQLWADVEAGLAQATLPGERELCRAEGRLDEIDSPDEEQRATIRDELISHITLLRHYLDYPVGKRVPVPLRDDRWRLIDALGDRYREETGSGDDRWEPVRVTGRRVVLSESPDQQSRVSLDFDNRMSQRALANAIKSVWPTLRERGFVRQTRPLKPRALALIRLICLDLPVGSTWSERLASWNKKHPDWPYETAYPMQRDFRRAEQQLTGSRYGLEWFYEPAARLSDDELESAAKQGDRRVGQYLSRLFDRQVALAFEIANDPEGEATPVATTRRFDALAHPRIFVQGDEVVGRWTRNANTGANDGRT